MRSAESEGNEDSSHRQASDGQSMHSLQPLRAALAVLVFK